MTSETQVELCRTIAEKAHAGQFRRDQATPYIVHAAAVAERLEGDPEAHSVAWLHDTIEDCGETPLFLLEGRVVS